MRRVLVLGSLAGFGLLTKAVSAAPDVEPGYHPYSDGAKPIAVIDLSAEAQAWRAAGEDEEPETSGGLPDGWVQVGDQVLPKEVALGIKAVDPEPDYAWEDRPGNKYPRKHTVYLNFDGGPMVTGKDVSAENKSTLARTGNYPGCGCGEQTKASIAQGFAQDVAKYGIRVMYQSRPSKTVPYTMVMFGGNACSNTNIEDCGGVGGVAPGADCEARGQRHVVYSFSLSANVASQEAGHSWGLDHTNNCSSVMSYCGGGNKSFSTGCDSLCEAACQGPNSIGCKAVHEKHCGSGSNAQNEDAELTFIFGGNEPDTIAPTVSIIEPMDGAEMEAPADVRLRAEVDDDYGGVGYRIEILQDGTPIWDEVDYHLDFIGGDDNVELVLDGLDPGTYELTVEAEDHADHVVSDTVTITVTGDGGGDGDGGTGDDGGTDTGGDGGDDGDAGDDGGDSGGTEGDDGDGDGEGGGDGDPGMFPPGDPDGRGSKDGCGCTTAVAPSGPVFALLGLVLALRRRSRDRRTASAA